MVYFVVLECRGDVLVTHGKVVPLERYMYMYIDSWQPKEERREMDLMN